MTTTNRQVATAEPPPAAPFIRFPDYQPSEETVSIYTYLSYPAYPSALSRHFGNADTTIISSEFAAALFPTGNRREVRYPDLLIAFNVDPDAFEARNGYLIPEQGKPPDFVLEIASKSTGREDETAKRADYESMGVLEYWRFDHTGGDYHSGPLAGDRLVDGRYVPIEIVQTGDESYRGHSDALNLDLCWECGKLRWYDPVEGLYLLTFDETDDERIAEHQGRIAERRGRILAEQRADTAERRADAEQRERIAAEQRADAEQRERIAAARRAEAAEARAEEERAARLALEAELRRLRGQ